MRPGNGRARRSNQVGVLLIRQLVARHSEGVL
jgi:hypothetical protein